MTKRLPLLAACFIGFAAPALAQSTSTSVFNCNPFNGSTSGVCSVQTAGTPYFMVRNGGAVESGGTVILSPTAAGHASYNMNTASPVNIQAFNTTFTFVPNGQGGSLNINNSNNVTGFNGNSFASGAGCEGGFFQAGATGPTNNGSQNFVFAAQFSDQQDYLTLAGNPYFSGSNVQIYQSQIVPCLPTQGEVEGWVYVATNRIPTFPVEQTSVNNITGSISGETLTVTACTSSTITTNQGVVGAAVSSGTYIDAIGTGTGCAGTYSINKAQNVSSQAMQITGDHFTSSGDTYSATYTYTGSALTLQEFNVTLGGSCPGPSCFTYTWQNVYIPTIVGATTAYIGLGTGTNQATLPFALTVFNWSYSTLTPAATPTFSPAAGTYSSTQSVTISDSTGSNYICYNFTGAPATNGIGGCAVGTLYSGAISVPKGATIYAVAGVPEGSADSAVASAAYNITGSASTPTYYVGGGTYSGAVTVTMAAAHGGVICFSTTTTPATNGSTGCTTGTLYSTPITVSPGTNNITATTTISAVAGGTGFTDSTVGAATYIINPFWDNSSQTSAGSGQAPANMPTFSPLPGTYSGAQTVTLSTTATGITTPYICYMLSSTTPTIKPQTDNIGGCANGTLYTGPINVSSTQKLFAMAGTPAGASLPSTLVEGDFTIAGTAAATPSCTPTSGSSTSPIAVACGNSNGTPTIMCFTEDASTPVTAGNGTTCTHGTALTGSSNTISIGSTVTMLEVVAGTSTLADSTVFTSGPYAVGAAATAHGVSAVGVKIQ